MEDLHVMKSGLEKAGKIKISTHHSGNLQGKRWNRGAERKSTRRVKAKIGGG